MAAGHEITDGIGIIHVSIVIRVIIVINVIIVFNVITDTTVSLTPHKYDKDSCHNTELER